MAEGGGHCQFPTADWSEQRAVRAVGAALIQKSVRPPSVVSSSYLASPIGCRMLKFWVPWPHGPMVPWSVVPSSPHWMLDVGCWMLLRGGRSAVELVGPLVPSSHSPMVPQSVVRGPVLRGRRRRTPPGASPITHPPSRITHHASRPLVAGLLPPCCTFCCTLNTCRTTM
jgi:hypothetical protein